MQVNDAVSVLPFLVQQNPGDADSDAQVGAFVEQQQNVTGAITIIQADFLVPKVLNLNTPGVTFVFDNVTTWCAPSFEEAQGVIERAWTSARDNGPVSLNILQFIQQNPQAAAVVGLGALANVPAPPGSPAADAQQDASADSNKGLKGWHIALIVIGGLVVLGAIVACTWLCAMRTLQRRQARETTFKRPSKDKLAPDSSSRDDMDPTWQVAEAALDLRKPEPHASPHVSLEASSAQSVPHQAPQAQRGFAIAGPLGAAPQGKSKQSRQSKRKVVVPSAAPTTAARRSADSGKPTKQGAAAAQAVAPYQAALAHAQRGNDAALPQSQQAQAANDDVYFDFVGSAHGPEARLQSVGPAASLSPTSRDLGQGLSGNGGAVTNLSRQRAPLQPPQTKGAVMYRMAEAMQARSTCNSW